METSPTIGKLTEALAKAQASFSAVKRTTKVDFLTRSGQKIKYSYAPLSDVLDACRKVLSDNGLAIMQPTKIVDGKLIVETLLSHISGEWIKGEILIESQTKDPQSEGSALTYARRYALSAMLGIASEEDDDAGLASDKENLKSTEKKAPVGKPPLEKIEAGKETKVHWCERHNEAFLLHTNKQTGATWWSHPLPDGSYCPMPKVKTKAEEKTLPATPGEEAQRLANFIKTCNDKLGVPMAEICPMLGVKNLAEWEKSGRTLQDAYAAITIIRRKVEEGGEGK